MARVPMGNRTKGVVCGARAGASEWFTDPFLWFTDPFLGSRLMA
jgi:hypothetical protein